MGSIPYDGGVTFRVWAPHARAVSVVGDFNGWEPKVSSLAREEGFGTWSGDLAGSEVGDEYRFSLTTGDAEISRIDPYARCVTHSSGNAIVTDTSFDWGASVFEMPSWDELVVYELHVGTFNDQPGGGPGGFAGVCNRLGYLADLGINAIELMPSVEFATDFSWGYNPSCLFAIEMAYGGPRALKKLVRTAHEHGIAVLFDVVYNHFGPSDLDLWQFDGWSENGKGGIYFYNDDRSWTPWGETRPDYGREEVRRFIADNARMWLEEFRLDGLRWDMTAFIRNVHGSEDRHEDIADGWRLMQQITSHTDQHQPWKLHIAEDLRGNSWLTAEAGGGGAGFDSQWDAGFVHPVRGAVITSWDHDRSMHAVRGAISRRDNDDALSRVIYTESHDEVANGRARVPHEISPAEPGGFLARKRSTLGAALVFTSPGIPMIFQGQEILEDQWFRDEDPIDWTKLSTFAGVHALYRDLARLRRNRSGTTAGLRGQHVNVHHVNDSDKVIAFHRWKSGGPRDDVVVVANMANRSHDSYRIGLPRPGLWRVRFNSDWTGYGADFDGHPSYDTTADGGPADELPFSGNVGIGRYTAVVLSQS